MGDTDRYMGLIPGRMDGRACGRFGGRFGRSVLQKRVAELGISVPTDIGGLLLWLDGSDASTITLNGSNVSQWADKSGNNYHATQTNATYQPLYVADGGVELNNKGLLRFNGSNHHMKLPNACMPIREHTAILVFKCNKATYSLMLSSFYGNAALLLDVNYTIWGSLSFFVSGQETRNDYGVNHRFDDNIYHYVIAKYDGTSITYKTNDDVQPLNPQVGLTGDIVYHAQNQAAIGSYLSTGGAFGHNHQGDIAEIILYNSAISTADHNKIDQYLSSKYSI